MTEWRKLPPAPPGGESGVHQTNPQPEPERVSDPLGIAAIVCGCVGIVAFGFVLAIVTSVLASVAGAKARELGRSLENAYIAFILAALDAVVFLVLHYAFRLPAFAG